MPVSQDAPYRRPLLIDVLRLLPVQPVRERDTLGVARYRALREGWGKVHGVRLSLEELNEVFVAEEGSQPRVSREGARLLLKLYEEGALERSPKRGSEAGIELLQAFVAGTASIVSPALLRTSGRRQARPARQPAPRPAAVLSKPEPAISQPSQPTRPAPERAYRLNVHRLLG
jgi:hypothetical protein